MDLYQNFSPNVMVCLAGFTILALASRQIGKYFTWAKLPLITGYLFTGILAGPYLLNLIDFESSSKLGFINDIALAFIAFAAGGELYLRELKSRISNIKWVTLGLTISTLILGSLTIFWLADYIPFMKGLPHVGRFAIAILGAAILVARSPSSAIAVIKELRARGRFTQTVLGVTVVMDVVVIILFSINHAVAQALLGHVDFGFYFICRFFWTAYIYLYILNIIIKVAECFIENIGFWI